jgi:hypothetical protein
MLLLLDVGADLKAENDVACLGFASSLTSQDGSILSFA